MLKYFLDLELFSFRGLHITVKDKDVDIDTVINDIMI